MQRLSADWVLPVSSPPIRDGVVLIDDDGRIAAVDSSEALPSTTDVSYQHFSSCALLPGLINTHTHLELTGFAGQVEEPDFWQWIQKVISIKSARPDEEFFEAACLGIEQMWASGVTTICDTGSTGYVLEALNHLDASGISHHEVFGAHPEQCQPAMKQFSRDLDRLARYALGRTSLGVSPHAPYTVSGELYKASCNLARAHGAPIAVHVAEPLGESQLLDDFTGIFADWWTKEKIPAPSGRPTTPMNFMDQNGVLSERTLCIHAIDVGDPDIELMSRRGVSVAHCPRSNRKHHQADAPIRKYLDAGLNVGLGTDSEISVAPPDLIAEAREARRLAGWTATETIRALTLGGAETIGRVADSGSLTRGKWADLVAIKIDQSGSPFEAVLGSDQGDVVGTWLGGRRVYQVRVE